MSLNLDGHFKVEFPTPRSRLGGHSDGLVGRRLAVFAFSSMCGMYSPPCVTSTWVGCCCCNQPDRHLLFRRPRLRHLTPVWGSPTETTYRPTALSVEPTAVILFAARCYV